MIGLRPGERVLVFGAVHTFNQNPLAAPAVIEPEPANNYRRWWNNPWNVVEAGGQTQAGAWTSEDLRRLRSLVDRAHAQGLWIRFYTLDGASTAEMNQNGWFASYNFGSEAAVKTTVESRIRDRRGLHRNRSIRGVASFPWVP